MTLVPAVLISSGSFLLVAFQLNLHETFMILWNLTGSPFKNDGDWLSYNDHGAKEQTRGSGLLEKGRLTCRGQLTQIPGNKLNPGPGRTGKTMAVPMVIRITKPEITLKLWPAIGVSVDWSESANHPHQEK